MIEIVQFDTSAATREFLTELGELLFEAFGSRFSQEDFEHCLGGTHICIRDSGQLVSHAAIVPRRLHVEHQDFESGYLEAVATKPDRQRKGLGAMIVNEANVLITREYELGALSSSSKGFYRKLGWEDWNGPSYVIRDGEWIRSESEDQGIMFLRTRANFFWQPGTRIACEDRSGDAW